MGEIVAREAEVRATGDRPHRAQIGPDLHEIQPAVAAHQIVEGQVVVHVGGVHVHDLEAVRDSALNGLSALSGAALTCPAWRATPYGAFERGRASSRRG